MSLVNQLLRDAENSQETEGILTENSAPKTSKQNLESKIESLIRSIENLTEKKLRLDFELKRQKKSLARKREELKRVSNSKTKAKVSLTLEGSQESQISETTKNDFKRTQSLLQKSARILEE